jgi:hypothetical protein
MIRKRMNEGFKIEPVLIQAPSEMSAFAMEIFWIAVIGREDLELGTLFNKTNGGEGVSGRVVGPEERMARSVLRKAEYARRTPAEWEHFNRQRSQNLHSKSDSEKAIIAEKISLATSASYQGKDEASKAEISRKKAEAKTKYHQGLSEEQRAARAKNIADGMARAKALKLSEKLKV